MKISERQFAIASVVSTFGLLIAWVIPNTIALRHLLLISGSLSAIGLINCHWNQFKITNARIFPLLCVFGLFVWVLIHYTFFSLNPQLEISEMKGLWMRSLLGVISAIGLGITICKYARLRLYFYIALFSTPLINVLAYCWASYLNRGLVKPNEFVFFLFAKIETAYFGAVAGAVAASNLVLLLVGKVDKSKILQILWWMLGLTLVLVSALVSSTKNGIAIALGLCIFLTIVVAINPILQNGRSSVLSAIVLTMITILSVGIWEGHKSFAYKGWETVFQDAAVAIDIDKNQQWQKKEGSVSLPLNSEGVEVALNTYSRFAYAAVGVRLISQYPFGYGSVNQSFKGMQEYAKIPHEHEGQVHSGWIDFGLGFGIPGLLLIFSALCSIIYFGLKDKSSITLPWAIVCLTLVPFGLIAEISYKQYFEATIFFLTIGATAILFAGNKAK